MTSALSSEKKLTLPTPEEALPGRGHPIQTSAVHYVLHTPICPPFPAGLARAMFGLGCFWGAERKFWQLTGVYTTAVGYAGGFTPNPMYEEVCTGLTGHTEVVLVIYNPETITYSELLRVFWESHNPTQGMRQGNDIGTQYRSAIYYTDEAQAHIAENAKKHYQENLKNRGFGDITTELNYAPSFYYAESYHQQYLAKNPNGYCGIGGLGVKAE